MLSPRLLFRVLCVRLGCVRLGCVRLVRVQPVALLPLLAAACLLPGGVAAAEPAPAVPPLHVGARVEVQTPFDGWQLGRVVKMGSIPEVRLDRPASGRQEVSALERKIRPLAPETERALRRAAAPGVGDRVDVYTSRNGWQTAVVEELTGRDGTTLVVAFDNPEIRGSTRFRIEDARPLPQGAQPRAAPGTEQPAQNPGDANADADPNANANADPAADPGAAPPMRLGAVPAGTAVALLPTPRWPALAPPANRAARPRAPRSPISLTRPAEGPFVGLAPPLLAEDGALAALWTQTHRGSQAWVQLHTDGRTTAPAALPRVPRSSALSPGGRSLFLLGESGADRDGRLTAVDPRRGEVLAEMLLPGDRFNRSTVIALDDDRVVVAVDGTATLWNLREARALWQVPMARFGQLGHEPSRGVLSLIADNSVHLLDAATGKALARSEAIADGITLASLAPTGERTLLVGGGRLIALDAAGEVVASSAAPENARAGQIDWFPDGRFAVLDGTWVIDTDPGRGYAAGRLPDLPAPGVFFHGSLFLAQERTDPPRIRIAEPVSADDLSQLAALDPASLASLASPGPLAVEWVATGNATADREAQAALETIARDAGYDVDPAASTRLVMSSSVGSEEAITMEFAGRRGATQSVTPRTLTHEARLEQAGRTLWSHESRRSFGPGLAGVGVYQRDRPIQEQVDEELEENRHRLPGLNLPSCILKPEFADGVVRLRPGADAGPGAGAGAGAGPGPRRRGP